MVKLPGPTSKGISKKLEANSAARLKGSPDSSEAGFWGHFKVAQKIQTGNSTPRPVQTQTKGK